MSDRRKLLSAAAVAALMAAASPAVGQEGAASFFDDFDTLDPTRWYVSDGWANGDFQNCGWTADQVTVADGLLRVGFAPGAASNRQYRCGEVRSRPNLLHGAIEARLKTPVGSGLNAAFFTYTGPTMDQPHDEIDFEFLLKDTGHVSTTTFVSGKSGDGTPGNGNGRDLPLPYPSDQDFVDLALVWTPEGIDMYVNHELVRTIDIPHEIPTHEQKVFFSLWGTDTLSEWMGPFAEVTSPIAMEVDWFAYTAPGDPCQFPDSIVCALEP